MIPGESANLSASAQNGFQVEESQVRQRRDHPSSLDKSSTPSPLALRSSSFATDSSFDDTRLSMRSSTDDLLRPRATGKEGEFHQEPSLWHSLPLLFAVVPAIGGVAFKSGSIFITDLSLLVLAAIYLNWCLTSPWLWYHTAQTVKITRSSTLDTIIEEAWEDGSGAEGKSAEDGNGTQSTQHSPQERTKTADPQGAALQELKVHEMLALASCLAGPLLGAYILHILRTHVSQLGDELVSNLNLTLFVLCAEIRPLRHLMKMAQARTLYLQKVVREDPYAEEKIDSTLIQGLTGRLNELESTISRNNNTPGTEVAVSGATEIAKKVQTTMQPQIDALNRAVRRYEKRATAQMIQTEARLQDLDKRLKDTLSLAAAAATYSQTPSTFDILLQWLSSLFLLPLRAAWAACVYPFFLANSALLAILSQLGLVQTGGKRSKTPVKSVPYTRMSRDTPVLRVVKKQ